MPEGQFTTQSPAESGGSSRRSAPPGRAGRARPRQGDPALAAKLRRSIQGEVLFDAAARGRYATDASVYQIEPVGVACPKSSDDVAAALAIAREEGVPVLARGGGTSQCGQTVGECLVLDMSRHMKGIVSVDPGARRARVQPGLVLDELNAALKQHGLWFPVDVSTSNRATLGGMAGNNSCGSRSIRYGTMADNVHAIDALLVDGGRISFGPVRTDLSDLANDGRSAEMARQVATLVAREQDEIRSRFPRLQRRVGGYNLDRVPPVAADGRGNMAQFLVGSEGTLALFTELDLPLQPIPASKTLGVCHFPTFYKAMDVTQHIVKLGPTAVELVDRTLIALARDIPAFAGSLDKFVRGVPDAILLVEFAEPDQHENLRRLRSLVELLADLGHPGSVVEATDPAFQREIWEIRKAGLNIMMSMKGEGKPVSFIEDCAVRLEDLAEYTRQLDEVFARHGTTGTWYAHASVGCLHVRPILNMKSSDGARTMRAIAEETFEIVRGYKGSHSGEHGDGIVRSEFHGPMFGQRMVAAFETAKAIFDPKELLNPGKIVRP
ncbi:MAG: FAD-binding oxidoreductase, partial [Alphaproteobacteria bacterium]|nr:FAD-binding oxidoreductase [Alphaproteobacteria bacterium]